MGTMNWPDADLRADFLTDNLSALGASAVTIERVRAARSAEIVEIEAGIEVVRIGGTVLGAPADDWGLDRTCRVGGRAPIVVFGLGTGDTVRSVRRASDAPVVVYEPDPSVARAVLEHGPTDLGDADLVCSLDELSQLWSGLAQDEVGATFVRTPGYPERFPIEHSALEAKLSELVDRSGINRNTHQQRARAWVEHLFANVRCLLDASPFVALRGRLEGVPAFIVGAGPSLAKNAALLRAATEKGLVIATNSSGRVLAKHEVEPQVFCCIESVDVSQLIASLPFVDRAIRAFSLSAHPNTFRTGRGPLFPVWEAIPELADPMMRLTGAPGLAVSGSVSTLAFSLAYALGCSPIVLVGQDLAYTGQRTHAEGSAFDASRVEIGADGRLRIQWCATSRGTRAPGDPPLHAEERLEEVTAWGGQGSVPSGQSFAGPRAWLSGAAEQLRQQSSKTELINATEGGSRIEGFTERRLAEVIAEQPDRGLSVDELCRMAKDSARVVDRPELCAWAVDERQRVTRVREQARRTRRAAQRARSAIERDRPQEVTRMFERLEESETALRAAVEAAPMVNAWAFAEVEAALQSNAPTTADDARQDALSSVGREVALARAIEDAARAIEDKLSQIIREPGAALVEPTQSQGEPDPCRL